MNKCGGLLNTEASALLDTLMEDRRVTRVFNFAVALFGPLCYIVNNLNRQTRLMRNRRIWL